MTGTLRRNGYSRLSIAIHWLTAILVISLFLTHESQPESLGRFYHVSGGAVAGLFLLWRVWYRISRGMTTKSDQLLIYNIASQVVIWGFLVALVLVIVTGYLIPWSIGAPVDFVGLLSVPSPMGNYPDIQQIMIKVHDVAGTLFPPLLGLHIIGAAKHLFIDKDGITVRMFKSISAGR